LSSAIAVASVWIGLTASYAIPKMPPSFAILAVATLIYLAAVIARQAKRRLQSGANPFVSNLGHADPAEVSAQ